MAWKPNRLTAEVLHVFSNGQARYHSSKGNPRLSDEPSDERRVERAQQTSERWREPDDFRPRR